jgi:hypothetical protein
VQRDDVVIIYRHLNSPNTCYSLGSDKWICYDCRETMQFIEAIEATGNSFDFQDVPKPPATNCVICGKLIP